MPSLHSAYPLITLYYGIKSRLGLVNILFATIMVGIWFAAVYSSHHYLLDVIAGVACAIIGIFIFQKWIAPNKKFHAVFIEKFVRD
jgi:membrane-associated phospholipid phosphatase